jgi:hypothetical protein
MNASVGISPEFAKVKDQSKIDPDLPLFCEKCGYMLIGLAPVQCHCCQMQYFRCPWCGNQQPLNTLRPALQQAIASVRGTGMVLLVQVKLSIVFFLLCAWGDFTARWALPYSYPYTGVFDLNELFAVCFNAVLTGLAGRLLLLWWRNSLRVGLVWGAVVVLAMVFGVIFRLMEVARFQLVVHAPWTFEFVKYLVVMWGLMLLGALAGRRLWRLGVRLFLPSAASRSLLEWYRPDRVSPPSSTTPDPQRSPAWRLSTVDPVT